MKRALLIAACSAACTAEEPATEIMAEYNLEAVAAVTGAHHVVGVDTDGAGGLWLVYQSAERRLHVR